MQAESPSKATEAERGTVLVVDDDDLLREAMSELLEHQGYLVEACPDAVAGLERLRAGLTPQVIVLDLCMPDMDGWEFRVIQKTHASWCDIPLIVVSGDRSAKAAAIDAEAFLSKPLCEKTLLETVDRLVRVAQQHTRGDEDSNLARLRDMGNMVTGISDQLTPSISALLDNLKLAERKAGELGRRLNAGDAFSLVGIRQLVQSAEKHGERARGVLTGVSLFCQMAMHSLAHKRRVLIAHREPRLAALLCQALEEEHQVVVVHSGREALRVLIEDNFDVFLCELALPDLHGIDIFEQLRADRPEQAQRMVFLTASGSFGERERAFFARHRPWQLRAPFRAADVRELIEAQWRSFH